VRDYIISFVLGITEGATEFVPVGASAHLRIATALLHVNLNGIWRLYLIVVHLGAVSAIMSLYSHQLREVADGDGKRTRTELGLISHSPRTVGLAFLVAGLSRHFLTGAVDDVHSGFGTIGVFLILGGIAMWVVDALTQRKPAAERSSMAGAAWIGACQSIGAICPGLSRSMLAMIAGEVAGLSRLGAVEFSFLLFVPCMLAEVFEEMLAISRTAPAAAGPVAFHTIAVLAVGFCTSSAAAYASADWMLRRSDRRGFSGFGMYRICAGLALLASALRWHAT
jgi:undecaprenyl-diphosphatase